MIYKVTEKSKKHQPNKRCPKANKCSRCNSARRKDKYRKRKEYHSRRMYAIQFLGARCNICGSTSDLEIDHVDPRLKTIEVSRPCSRQKFFDELEKCQLLCYSCHKEKSDEEKRNPLPDLEEVPF